MHSQAQPENIDRMSHHRLELSSTWASLFITFIYLIHPSVPKKHNRSSNYPHSCFQFVSLPVRVGSPSHTRNSQRRTRSRYSLLSVAHNPSNGNDDLDSSPSDDSIDCSSSPQSPPSPNTSSQSSSPPPRVYRRNHPLQWSSDSRTGLNPSSWRKDCCKRDQQSQCSPQWSPEHSTLPGNARLRWHSLQTRDDLPTLRYLLVSVAAVSYCDNTIRFDRVTTSAEWKRWKEEACLFIIEEWSGFFPEWCSEDSKTP